MKMFSKFVLVISLIMAAMSAHALKWTQLNGPLPSDSNPSITSVGVLAPCPSGTNYIQCYTPAELLAVLQPHGYTSSVIYSPGSSTGCNYLNQVNKVYIIYWKSEPRNMPVRTGIAKFYKQTCVN